MVKVALAAPAGIDTEAGTRIVVTLLVRATLIPTAGATAFSVTVPVAFVPPNTEAGATVNEVKVYGLRVTVAVFED